MVCGVADGVHGGRGARPVRDARLDHRLPARQRRGAPGPQGAFNFNFNFNSMKIVWAHQCLATCTIRMLLYGNSRTTEHCARKGVEVSLFLCVGMVWGWQLENLLMAGEEDHKVKVRFILPVYFLRLPRAAHVWGTTTNMPAAASLSITSLIPYGLGVQIADFGFAVEVDEEGFCPPELRGTPR